MHTATIVHTRFLKCLLPSALIARILVKKQAVIIPFVCTIAIVFAMLGVVACTVVISSLSCVYRCSNRKCCTTYQGTVFSSFGRNARRARLLILFFAKAFSGECDCGSQK